MMFFPAAGIVEIDSTDFTVVDERDDDRPQEEEPRRTNRVTTDPMLVVGSDIMVRNVVGALINAPSVPLSEFYLAVSALRSSRTRRQRAEQ